jgi:hypothetical protein
MTDESVPVAESLVDSAVIEPDDELSSSQFGRLTVDDSGHDHVAGITNDDPAFQTVSLTAAVAENSPVSARKPAVVSPESGTAAASLASTLDRSDHKETQTDPKLLGTNAKSRDRSSSVDRFREWGVIAYKCTRQMLSERFGRGSKTVDTQLDFQVQKLRDIQHKYSDIIRLARQLSAQLFTVFQTHRALGDAFGEQSARSSELHDEFKYNSDTQRLLFKNGETLLSAINFFVANLSTLCTKTIEDTLATVKRYDAARVEYDAYRTDLEEVEKIPVTNDAQKARLDAAKSEFANHRQGFDNLRQDVYVKLRLLDENRV